MLFKLDFKIYVSMNVFYYNYEMRQKETSLQALKIICGTISIIVSQYFSYKKNEFEHLEKVNTTNKKKINNESQNKNNQNAKGGSVRFITFILFFIVYIFFIGCVNFL